MKSLLLVCPRARVCYPWRPALSAAEIWRRKYSRLEVPASSRGACSARFWREAGFWCHGNGRWRWHTDVISTSSTETRHFRSTRDRQRDPGPSDPWPEVKRKMVVKFRRSIFVYAIIYRRNLYLTIIGLLIYYKSLFCPRNSINNDALC